MRPPRRNFWGYSTAAFFAPMARYSDAVARGDPGGSACTELKALVRECHARGIEVFMDVVFNHTAEGNQHGPSISLRWSSLADAGADIPSVLAICGIWLRWGWTARQESAGAACTSACQAASLRSACHTPMVPSCPQQRCWEDAELLAPQGRGQPPVLHAGARGRVLQTTAAAATPSTATTLSSASSCWTACATGSASTTSTASGARLHAASRAVLAASQAARVLWRFSGACTLGGAPEACRLTATP